MKKFGKVFWGVLCMMLLFAFSHASADNICAPNINLKVVNTKEKVQFKWNAVKKYENRKDIDKKDGIIMYQVYRFRQIKDEQPPRNNADKFKYEDRTDKLYREIKFQDAGRYFLGVQAFLYKSKGGKPIGKPINKSTISWSCNKSSTNNKPQYVKFSK